MAHLARSQAQFPARRRIRLLIYMINFFAILALGFFLGARHATDPDHVVAVTTIVARERNLYRSAIIGILWGIGHTFTILLVGGMIILFGLVIPPRLGLTMELSVALMLVFLGVFNLNSFWQSLNEIKSDRAEGTPVPRAHSHFHAGSGTPGRPHENDLPWQTQNKNDPNGSRFDQIFSQLGLLRTLRPVVVGIVHGLAGSAAIALLILATIRNPIWAMAYLILFGLGTVAGMAAITTAIAVPSVYGTRRFAKINRYFVIASGLLSFGFGLFLAYHISFVNGLFSSHPMWTPK
jgi:ABC-type nickel/cobalt efflux system permease component RcnA